jgi:ribonuclease III
MAAPAAELAHRLGLRFTDLRLLTQALVHSSYTNERPAAGEPNERLEFLGDAVVALIVSELLWQRHPGEDEGSLTTRRAAIVSAPALAGIAERLDLGSHLMLGQGAQQAGERRRQSVLAGVFEAVVGAIYLEFGLHETRRWLLAVAAPELDVDRSLSSLKAPKSVLQERSYALGGAAPRYSVVKAEGPDHARRYLVEVAVGGEVLGRGEGRNRREAETAAAVEALAALDERDAVRSSGA